MGKITLKLNDDLETDLRIAIAKRRGRKGDLTKAIEEGIRLWLREKSLEQKT